VHGPIRVGIADDDEFVRIFLSRSLSRLPGLHVVAAVEDGEAAVRLTQTGHIDVLVLDLEMPIMPGTEALRRIRASAPQVGVVVHSSLPAETRGAEMLRAGAESYLEKPCTPERMLQAIRKAHERRRSPLQQGSAHPWS
jgi:DNA-binding NarL/FixJ family response regulator